MKKVLLVDDDLDIHNIIKHALQGEYNVLAAENLSQGAQVILEHEIDLIVLDEGLPDGSGTAFCYKLKNEMGRKRIPILMLTKRQELKDKIMAFNSGADDYIVKPFEPLELLARVNARLRDIEEQNDNLHYYGDLELDLTLQRLSIRKGTEEIPVEMTPIEFKILYQLTLRDSRVMSREDILNTVWGKNSVVSDRTVDQHISKIRKKLGASNYTIKSSHGQGYLLIKE